MKMIRMTHELYTRWRTNRPVLIDEEGNFVRNATDAEVQAEFKARQRGSVVKVLDQGKKLTLSSERERIRKELLAAHGDCRLLSFTGKFVANIRDATKDRVSAKAPEGRFQVSPENCICAKWGGRQAGRHHPACVHNKHAPEEQRGYPREELLETVPAEAAAANPAASESRTPAPEECNCRDWAKPGTSDPNLHHPTCVHFDPWNLRASPNMVVLDERGVELRPATTDEVKLAEHHQEEHGVPFLLYGELKYLVVPARVQLEVTKE